jgi:hypothetical protein
VDFLMPIATPRGMSVGVVVYSGSRANNFGVCWMNLVRSFNRQPQASAFADSIEFRVRLRLTVNEPEIEVDFHLILSGFVLYPGAPPCSVFVFGK